MKEMKVLFAILIVLTFSTDLLSQNIWQKTNGPYGGIIGEIAVSPNGNIFIHTFAAGIFRSSNNGLNWEQINEGLPIYDWEDRSILTVRNDGIIFSSWGTHGIYKTTNNGNTWIPTGLNNVIVSCVIIKQNGYMFAGTPTGAGIYRSTDGGVTWIQINNGLTSLAIQSLCISSNGDIFTSTYSGVYRSTNNGDVWTQTGLTLTIESLSAYQNIIYASNLVNVFRTSDYGSNWQNINYGLPPYINKIAADPAGNVFAVTDRGIYRSTNSGGMWNLWGLSSEHVLSFVMRQTGYYFAGTRFNGVYCTTNNGSNWGQTNHGITSSIITRLTISSSGNIYAGTWGIGGFRSSNNGSSWVRIIDKHYREYVYAMMECSNGHLIAATDSGIYKSTNMGTSWSWVWGFGHVSQMAFNQSGHIFAALSYHGFGVLKSTNCGNNWSIAFSEGSNYSIAVNRNGDIYVGTSGGGIYRSTDNGSSWLHTGIYGVVNSIECNQYGHIFAGIDGIANEGIYRSVNNGLNWVWVGLPYEDIIAISVNQIGHLYAGVFGFGVFKSTNNGDNWTQVNCDIFSGLVTSLAVNPGGYLFAGTYGAGVYKTINSTIGIEKISSQVPGEFLLSQNFPNPFNSSTRIEFALPKTLFVKLRIFDMNGKEISSLVNEELDAGIYMVDWDAANYSSGVYFYRLEAGEFVESKRMILIK